MKYIQYADRGLKDKQQPSAQKAFFYFSIRVRKSERESDKDDEKAEMKTRKERGEDE